MNIFYVNTNPDLSSRQLCNKHIVKMPSETVNMLLLPFKLQGIEIPPDENGKHIKLSHQNHPCSIFTRESFENYTWVWQNFYSMCYEYEIRYKRKHKSFNWYKFISRNVWRLTFPKIGATPFPRCFGSVISTSDYNDLSTVELYHKYYWLDKQEFARWPSLDKIPSWWYGGRDPKWVDPSFCDGEYTKR